MKTEFVMPKLSLMEDVVALRIEIDHMKPELSITNRKK